MQAEKITIDDIAKKLKLSASSVSRALRNHPKISHATKEKVFAMAEKLGYKTNSVKLNMLSNNNIIALIVPEIESVFYQEFVKHLQKQAEKENYSVLLFISYESLKNELKQAEMLKKIGILALIVSLSVESANANHFVDFQKNGTPIILVDRVDYQFKSIKIVMDNFSVAYKAIEHFAINHYQRIAFLSGPPELSKFSEMIKGYKAGLKASKLELDEKLLICSDLTESDILIAMDRLLSLKTLPDAIFIANSKAAALVLNILKQNSLQVPSDLGLLSLDFDYSHKFIQPSISIIEQPAESMAKLTVQQIVIALKTKKNLNATLIKPAKLIIRNSSLSIK